MAENQNNSQNNQFEQTIDLAIAKLDALRGVADSTDAKLNDINTTLNLKNVKVNAKDVDKVKELADTITDLMSALKELKGVEKLPSASLNRMLNQLTKFTQTKFDTKNFKNLAKDLSNLNGELSKFVKNFSGLKDLGIDSINTTINNVTRVRNANDEFKSNKSSEFEALQIRYKNKKMTQNEFNKFANMELNRDLNSGMNRDKAMKKFEKRINEWPDLKEAMQKEKNAQEYQNSLPIKQIVKEAREAARKESEVKAAKEKLDIYRDTINNKSYSSVAEVTSYKRNQYVAGEITLEQLSDFLSNERKPLQDELDKKRNKPKNGRYENTPETQDKAWAENADRDAATKKKWNNMVEQAYKDNAIFDANRDKKWNAMLDQAYKDNAKLDKDKENKAWLNMLNEAYAENKRRDKEWSAMINEAYAENKRIDKQAEADKKIEDEKAKYARNLERLNKVLENTASEDVTLEQVRNQAFLKFKSGEMSEEAYNDFKYNEIAYYKKVIASHKESLMQANRGTISGRIEDKAKAKTNFDRLKLSNEIANSKRNAQARVFEGISSGLGLGGNKNMLADILEATGLSSKQTASIKEMQLFRQAIKDKQAEYIKQIDNREMSDKIKINKANIPQKSKEENLNKLAAKNSERRAKINDAASKALIANENNIAAATLKLGGTLTVAAIGIQVMVKTLKEAYKMSKEAADSQTALVSALRQMGMSTENVDNDALYFTNTLQNLSADWQNIKNTLGDSLMNSFSGLLMMADYFLKGVNEILKVGKAIFDLAVKFNTFGLIDVNPTNSTSTTKEDPKSSAYKMLKIVERLEKGVTKNGVRIVVDRKEAAKALDGVFNKANVLGIDNDSAANISESLSNIALDIMSKYGGTYSGVMNELSNTVYNGGTDASKYGVAVDDQTLAGWAASEKGLDIVNVQYTDAYKAGLRYEMMMQQVKSGNSDFMQNAIKEWKTLGNVIQSCSGQLYDFQEVQGIQGKNFEIPEIDKNGIVDSSSVSSGIDSGNTETLKEQLNLYDEYNNKIKETGQLYVMTADGMKTLSEAYDYIGGDLSKLCLLYNDLTGTYVLATDDYLPSLTDEERKHFKLITDDGLVAYVMYCDQLGLTKTKTESLAKAAGFTSEQLEGVKAAAELIEKIPVDYSDLESAKAAADALAESLKNVAGINPNTGLGVNSGKYNNVFGYSDRIIDYANRGYKFTDGSTVEDLNGDGKKGNLGDIGTYLNGTLNPFSVKDREKVNTTQDFWDESGTVGKIASGTTAVLQFLSNPIASINGHADGGISTSAHLANISEGNKAEAIIPLESSLGVNALSQALVMAGAGQTSQGGVVVENLNVNNDGINIAENQNQWRTVAKRIGDELDTLQRERGNMNYGIN